ncbi:MAG TPA: sigma-70 family RNA polymerase sigma factor [Solirubrobacteraceae bacterium]|jgi:RNA polymerase sigma factor (sigma-70 family)
MDDVQGEGRGSSAAEELILRTVAAHADSLLRTARRYSICTDDAQDAYQRALEIFMGHADRLDPARAAGWLHVVVKREALAIRRSRKKLVGSVEVDLDAQEARRLPTPDEQLLSFDMINRSAEALQRLKPQELRALWLKAQGHSYNDIGAITGWSYTKVNRCLTEGRRSFLERYAGIESGAECRRWMPVISAMVDGEATPEQIVELRPHLRNCPGCRATLKALHDSSAPLSAVLPIPLVAVANGGGGDQISNLVMRAYEAIAGGLHERAIHSVTKAQAAIDAAAAGKVAAVAASAAALAGGGYATVEQAVERTTRHEHASPARKIARHDVVSPRRKVATRLPVPAVPAPAAPSPRRVKPAAAAPAPQTEFEATGAPVTSGTRAGYEPTSHARSAGAASAAVATPGYTPARTASPKPAPELSSADAGSEFGP